MNGAGPVLQARDLRVWYGTEGDPVRAVDGVSLDIVAGTTLGVVGASGCGTSTLGRGHGRLSLFISGSRLGPLSRPRAARALAG